jgi:hypothetical protein
MELPRYTPGFVESVDRARRLVRVRIPGVTDGAETQPEAHLLYPLGDKSEHTEIRLVAGDRVWLDFFNGDPRYPIILGYRPKETDNAAAWRRWHHDNVELQADEELRLLATGARVVLEAGTNFEANAATNIEATAGTNVTVNAGGQVVIEAPSIVLRGAITLDGNVQVTGTLTVQQLLTWLAGMSGTGQAVTNGKRIDQSHRHNVPGIGLSDHVA